MHYFQSFSRSILAIFVLFVFSLCSAAQVDYQAAADDITQRLDTALTQYKDGKIDDAKRGVQMAYFSVYEGIEGPIRINYSAQYSAELEGKFGEIRKMIAAKKPVAEVEKEVAWLKSEINSLPEKLASGHQLIAENNDLSADSIAPQWQTLANNINEAINVSVWAYKNNEQEKAIKTLEQAMTDYTASGLPASFSDHDKAQANSDILGYFSEMSHQFRLNPDAGPERIKQTKEIAYQGYLLTQTLGEALPGLPAKSTQAKSVSSQSAANTIASPVNDSPTQSPIAEVSDHDWMTVNQQILNAVDAAMTQYASGEQDKAISAIQDAYFDTFEATGYENAIGAKDSHFKVQLESHFTKMVGLMTAKRPIADLKQVRDAQAADLTKAASLLGDAPTTFWEVAIQAFLILIREGLEAMLVVAAIAAYLVKNEHNDKMWVVKQSVVVGLLASLATAYIFSMVFANAGVGREILEGVTMLIAVVVLFFMSYWLLSKVEAHQWQAYLKNKLSRSLTTGSIIGLWLASFLAIYREGAETVLFYFALSAGVPGGGWTGIAAGVVGGTVVLLVAYYLMRYTVVKLPLKPFFLFTGLFMYVMAFIFAGKGVMELVEGKLFMPTIVSGAPEIHWLGIYPYVESLAPQVLLILAAIFAWMVIKLRAKRA